MIYGKLPVFIGQFDISLEEVMYYLYLPIRMRAFGDIRMPGNLGVCRPMVHAALGYVEGQLQRGYKYVYLSARKGWATPDNPLNRPGWHCDGFGTDDLNFVWWDGPGTRFAIQRFEGIVSDHNRSQQQFGEQVTESSVRTYQQHWLMMIDPLVVHATPIIPLPGCMRQYIKVSLSNSQYNLENNSHNYEFGYKWALHPRDLIRNDPNRSQLDYLA